MAAILDRLEQQSTSDNKGLSSGIDSSAANLARHYRDRLIKEQIEQLSNLAPRDQRAKIEAQVDKMIDEEKKLIPPATRIAIINIVVNETIGYGPLQVLLQDEDITEIMVNWVRSGSEDTKGSAKIFIERAGRLIEEQGIRFDNRDHLLHIIDRIVSPLGRRIDESRPMVDARLPDGSRVNAIISPLAIDGPVLTIRRFRKRAFSADELVNNQTLSLEMLTFLKVCVEAKLNILVSGGTGSGKTTTLNLLSSFIPKEERIVTIEDAAELRFHENHSHVVRLETRPPNIEGSGEVTIRDLVRNSLRMRPDRIIVGEVRGAEALDMLQAMNTGHEGSMTTVHANSTRDAFARLENMVMWAEGAKQLPLSAIREQLTSALSIVIQQDRLPGGVRKITRISEVQGVYKGEIILRDIFLFQQKGLDETGKARGFFTPTGVVPRCINNQLKARLSSKEVENLGHLFKLDYFVAELGQELLTDQSVSEIMINGPENIYIERSGRLEQLPGDQFKIEDDQHLRNIIETIAAHMSRRISERMPMLDARLPDNSRVNAILPPASGDHPTITIRRFRQESFTFTELEKRASLDRRMADFLQACVKAKLNILVSGGTGSGKTTLLNVLSQSISDQERIITMEDVRELRLDKRHLLSQETRPPDEFGEGEVTMRDLVRNCLRMRPDRIIVGEVRGGEALDMLQAINTGHDGSLTTIHANNPKGAFARLETLVRMAPEGSEFPVTVIRQQMCAFQIVVQQDRLADGTRKVVSIFEVQGLNSDGQINLVEIFKFSQSTITSEGEVLGEFQASGVSPLCRERIKQTGINFPDAIFDPDQVYPELI